MSAAYFCELQSQPALHRQVLLHAQRSPQMQRSTLALAHPHEVFSHRHCFWVLSAIGLSWLCRALLRGSPRETQTVGAHYTRHGWTNRKLRFPTSDAQMSRITSSGCVPSREEVPPCSARSRSL